MRATLRCAFFEKTVVLPSSFRHLSPRCDGQGRISSLTHCLVAMFEILWTKQQGQFCFCLDPQLDVSGCRVCTLSLCKLFVINVGLEAVSTSRRRQLTSAFLCRASTAFRPAPSELVRYISWGGSGKIKYASR